MKARISRTLIVLMSLSLAGTTELAQAWQQAVKPQQTQTQNTQTQTPAADTTAKPADTTAKPAETDQASPAKPAPEDVLPSAPSATTQEQTTQTATKPATTTSTTQEQTPLGAAAAENARTNGGAASKPAGTALAGVKQKQSRGLLIKMGAILAAGAAVGTVYALSRGTTPVPPGAGR